MVQTCRNCTKRHHLFWEFGGLPGTSVIILPSLFPVCKAKREQERDRGKAKQVVTNLWLMPTCVSRHNIHVIYI